MNVRQWKIEHHFPKSTIRHLHSVMAAPCVKAESVTGVLNDLLSKLGFEVYPLKVWSRTLN